MSARRQSLSTYLKGHVARLCRATSRARAITVHVAPEHPLIAHQVEYARCNLGHTFAGSAVLDFREVYLSMPPDTPRGYALALHEIGHIKLRHFAHFYDGPDKIVRRELEAWQWSYSHAKVWTDDSTWLTRKCLGSYVTFHGPSAGLVNEIQEFYASLTTIANERL